MFALCTVYQFCLLIFVGILCDVFREKSSTIQIFTTTSRLLGRFLSLGYANYWSNFKNWQKISVITKNAGFSRSYFGYVDLRIHPQIWQRCWPVALGFRMRGKGIVFSFSGDPLRVRALPVTVRIGVPPRVRILLFHFITVLPDFSRQSRENVF